MSDHVIYYNPKCGTCRKVLDALKARRITPRIVEYLKNPPSEPEIAEIAKKCGGAHNIVRAKEPEYAEEGLSAESSDRDIVKAIARHPVLLQRPIVVAGKKAVVARPPERLADLF